MKIFSMTRDNWIKTGGVRTLVSKKYKLILVMGAIPAGL